jgi:flagellar hook assembly protein FlgD
LPEDNNVLLEVYDINGRNISRLIDNTMKAGYHSVLWNAERYSSGVYIIRMQAGDFRSSQKLMLVK